MAVVTGTLWDAGLGHLAGKQPELLFTLNAPQARAGALYPTEAVKVTPAADGTFTANLAPTTDMLDDAWYTLKIQWVNSVDPKGYAVADFPDWAMQVPASGGPFTDLFGRPPSNTRVVYVSLTPPGSPRPFTLWLKQDPTDSENPLNTGELYEWRNA